MALEPLITTDKLKTNFLVSVGKSKVKHLYVNYDPDFDALILSFAPLETDTIVHYIDEHIGLLYRADDLEIVGIQVEDFEYSFLPNHAAVQRVWKLGENRVELSDIGDMIAAIENAKPRVALEVVKAAEKMLGTLGDEMIAALAS